MARSELLYRGRLKLGAEAEPAHLEVWMANGAAVAFEGGTQRGAMRNVTVGLTDDGRLFLSGTDATTDAPITWEGPDPARNEGQWPGMKITWPDGTVVTAATITWTQYAVTVAAAGHPNRVFPGARTEVTAGQKWIINGAERQAVLPAAAKCGSCGGGGR